MNSKAHERLKNLFAEINRLANDANNSASSSISKEIEMLKQQLIQLEADLSQEKEVEIKEALSTKLLYQQDKIAYSFSNGKLESNAQELSSNATVIPFVAGDQTLGEVFIEKPQKGDLTASELNLIETITQQASLQIQNLRLLSETEKARTEAEQATRQFMHKNWDSYLDAIQNNQRIGYTYDQNAVTPFTEKIEANPDLDIHKSISIMNEQIGSLYLKPNPSRPLDENDIALINTVTAQIGQQVENIRLLADATRARSEAEEAIRQSIRTNWDKFTNNKEDDTSALRYVYNSVNVQPLEDESVLNQVTISQPLIIRGETIGELSVANLENISSDMLSFASAIAEQTSIHLETLRLNEELQARAIELQELDRLKSAFLANMSHELRTPLNSILGFTDVILEGLDGPLTPTMSNDLKLINKNGQHLLHLINDVLDMAKIESGKMNLIIEKFSLYEVFDEVINITSPFANEKNLSLSIDKESNEEIRIHADRTRLRQVMINILNNALKFTEKGKILINAQQDEEQILISVKDTGIGIPPEHLESIFSEFTQVDSSTTRKVGGTGLGLPISRKLIHLHGGRIWAESTGIEGEGSTFYISMPIEIDSSISEPVTREN